MKRLSDFRTLSEGENPNKHTERGIGMLGQSMDSVGFTAPMIASADGVILAGNARAESSALKFDDEVIIVESDGTKPIIHVRSDIQSGTKKAKEIILLDNRVGEVDLAWDADVIRELSQEIDLSQYWHEDELIALLDDREARVIEETEPKIGNSDDLQKIWQVQEGDIYEIESKTVPGKSHRVMCGDSTNADNVARLLQNYTPQLMITDPPYGVNYDPEWRPKSGINRSYNRTGKVTNDDRSSWFEAWNISPADVVYIWHGYLSMISLWGDLTRAGFEPRAQIIWNKEQLVFGRGHYHWKHEPCIYAVRKGKTANWIGDRTQTTVWDIRSDSDAPGGYSTQKPVECMARPIRNHVGDVYDPFLGSGTTLVACEQSGRIGYGMEIAPTYVAVILQRLTDLGLAVRKL